MLKLNFISISNSMVASLLLIIIFRSSKYITKALLKYPRYFLEKIILLGMFVLFLFLINNKL